MGKRLDDSLSPAASAGRCHPNLSARHTRSKPNKYMKQGEPSARPRPASTEGSIDGERKRCGRLLSFATFAEKERKKMTLLKQTMSSLQRKAAQHGCSQPTGAATDVGAINPCPPARRPRTGPTAPQPPAAVPRDGSFSGISAHREPRPQLGVATREIIRFLVLP